MFTGLVQHVGVVRRVQGRGGGEMVRLGVDAGALGSWGYAKRARVGDSVCVAGVCLTIVSKRRAVFEFDVVAETLAKTRLGELRVGARVNLEHAATAATFLGGHIVQGHVDGVGRVTRVKKGADWRMWVEMPRAGGLERFVVEKGSVCVEGVSLTVAEVKGREFWVALIPETLERTTLRELEVGDRVNLEVDVIGKMVVGVVERMMGKGRAQGSHVQSSKRKNAEGAEVRRARRRSVR